MVKSISRQGTLASLCTVEDGEAMYRVKGTIMADK